MAAFAALLAIVLASPSAVSAQAAPARVQTLSWRPNGSVEVIASTQSRVFLGGDFTRMVNTRTHRKVTRVRVAALARRNGALIKSFRASVNGSVMALAVFDHKLYLGGNFTRVNGFGRRHLAALRLSDGHVVRGQHIQVNGPVRTLLHMGHRLYVGGGFTSAGGVHRSKLFALSPKGTVVRNWPVQTAATDGGVYVLAASPHHDRVIVGGAFHHLVGQSRTFLGAITTAGQVTRWSPAPACSRNCFVLDLATGTTRVYAAIAGPGGHATAYRLSNGGTAWTVRTNGDVSAIARSGSHLLLGGHFNRAGGRAHTMFAEVAAGTGAVLTRKVSTSGQRYPGILDIDVRGRVAVLGGAFDDISGQRRLAAVAA